ncbi:MAG: helix-turn-helix domain-containing protein [Blastocatellia bacterium]|nr:helix-turn-helix domain-containing protein [Blastocatellia bacterium]
MERLKHNQLGVNQAMSLDLSPFLERFAGIIADAFETTLRRELDRLAKEKPRPRLLNVAEAAEFLRIDQSTLYRFVADEEIPFRKVGTRTVFLESELLDWTASDRMEADRPKLTIRRGGKQ